MSSQGSRFWAQPGLAHPYYCNKSLDIKGFAPPLNYACVGYKGPVSTGLAICKAVRRRGHIHRHSMGVKRAASAFLAFMPKRRFSRWRSIVAGLSGTRTSRRSETMGRIKRPGQVSVQFKQTILCTQPLNTFLLVLQDKHVLKYIAERRHARYELHQKSNVGLWVLGGLFDMIRVCSLEHKRWLRRVAL